MIQESSEVIRAFEEFYAALNILFEGEASPMKALWSHADDVTYLGPEGGIVRGWDLISPIWDKQASLLLKGKVEPKNVHMILSNEIAIVQNIEEGANIVDDETEEVSIRATNIFRREQGEWKMISHQTDRLAFLK